MKRIALPFALSQKLIHGCVTKLRKNMNALTIENTSEQVLISIDKKLISTEALANIIRLLELETMAQHINFSSELIELGNTIKQEWWQENKKRLLKTP
jgi:hypothetical protein